MSQRALILGMGNSILTDDAAGLKLASMAHEVLHQELPDIELKLSESGGMNLLDMIEGYDAVFVVDSMLTGKHAPGTAVEIEPGPREGTRRTLSSHDISLFDAINLGNKLGTKMPSIVRIFAMEIVNNTEFSQFLTQEVEASLEKACKEITSQISLSLATAVR